MNKNNFSKLADILDKIVFKFSGKSGYKAPSEEELLKALKGLRNQISEKIKSNKYHTTDVYGFLSPNGTFRLSLSETEKPAEIVSQVIAGGDIENEEVSSTYNERAEKITADDLLKDFKLMEKAPEKFLEPLPSMSPLTIQKVLDHKTEKKSPEPAKQLN